VTEAAVSALHFFRGGWQYLTSELESSPSDSATALEQLGGAVENAYITDDSVTFPGREEAPTE
jgi:hypothetical protein